MDGGVELAAGEGEGGCMLGDELRRRWRLAQAMVS